MTFMRSVECPHCLARHLVDCQVDFVPNGMPVPFGELLPAERIDAHTAQCHRRIGDDAQSGPHFCGEPATYRAYNRDGLGCYVAWCDAHVPREVKEAAEKAGKGE